MRLREPIVLGLAKTSLIQSVSLFLLFFDLFLLYWVILVKLIYDLVLLLDLQFGWMNICSQVEPEQWGSYCSELSKVRRSFSLTYVIAQFTLVPIGLNFIIILCVEILFEYSERSTIFYNWWRHIVHKTLPLEKIEWGG